MTVKTNSYNQNLQPAVTKTKIVTAKVTETLTENRTVAANDGRTNSYNRQ